MDLATPKSNGTNPPPERANYEIVADLFDAIIRVQPRSWSQLVELGFSHADVWDAVQYLIYSRDYGFRIDGNGVALLDGNDGGEAPTA
jgi:hypothetical protein